MGAAARMEFVIGASPIQLDTDPLRSRPNLRLVQRERNRIERAKVFERTHRELDRQRFQQASVRLRFEKLRQSFAVPFVIDPFMRIGFRRRAPVT